MRKRIAVIGAGPAGLAAAVHALDRGGLVEVFEAGDCVGGLAKTVNLWGHNVDLGSHIFSGASAEATAMWQRFIGPAPRRLRLKRAILRSGKVLHHPPQALDLVQRLPPLLTVKCALGAVIARLNRRVGPPPSLVDAEAWVSARFGRAAYDALFRDYLEKLWGTSGSRIDARFASALFAEKGRLDAAAMSGADDGTFEFPRSGTGSVWNRMRDHIERRGVIHLRTPVESIRLENGCVSAVCANGNSRPFDHVISSMPLRMLMRALGAPATVAALTEGLTTRNVILVHLHVRGGYPLDHTWIYVYDRDLEVGRIVDNRTWQGTDETREGVVTMEYWCAPDSDTWAAADDEIVALARRELSATSLFDRTIVLAGVVSRLPRALPVPAVESRESLGGIASYLGTIGGFKSVGRHGEFAYNSMATSMDSGILAAEGAFT